MSSIDHFTGRVESYDRYRQRYPASNILELLQEWCGLQPGWTIADIGAGTGMLSEVFLSNQNPVIAIEPNPEMLDTCRKLLKTWPLLRIIQATAEVTTLPANSVDIVAAGRAFHWFDIPRALAEFRRILKPGGWVVLVSLGRAKDTAPQSLDFEQLLIDYGMDYAYVRAGYRIHENLPELFPAAFHRAQIHAEQRLDWPSFLGQTLSLSVVPPPTDPRFAAFESALRQHFDRYAAAGIITLPTTCWIDAGRLSTQ